MAADNHAWWKPVVHFLTHTIVGSVIFVIVAIPAWLLGLVVKWLGSNGAAPYVVSVLTFLEYAIVTIDAILVIAYLVYTGWKAAKEFK